MPSSAAGRDSAATVGYSALQADFIFANPPFNISGWAVSACATMSAGSTTRRRRVVGGWIFLKPNV